MGSAPYIQTSAPRAVFDTRFKLGESPIWDEKQQRLLWVDQEGKRIHSLTPASGEHTSFPTTELTPAVILSQNPDVLVVPMEQNIYTVDLSQNGAVRSVLATVPEDQGSNKDGLWRFNDSRAAPGGQIIAGRMTQDHWKEGVSGWVYTLHPGQDGGQAQLEVLFQQGRMGLPNGMAWNLAKGEMYYADTYSGKVIAIPCDAATGQPDAAAPWRTVLKLDESTEGAPDGMAIDAAGNLWVAHEQGGQVGCYDADTGERLHSIEMPCKRPSGIAFGGADLSQLYIATIREEGEDASPQSGKLFVVDVTGAAGASGAHKYRGDV